MGCGSFRHVGTMGSAAVAQQRRLRALVSLKNPNLDPVNALQAGLLTLRLLFWACRFPKLRRVSTRAERSSLPKLMPLGPRGFGQTNLSTRTPNTFAKF